MEDYQKAIDERDRKESLAIRDIPTETKDNIQFITECSKELKRRSLPFWLFAEIAMGDGKPDQYYQNNWCPVANDTEKLLLDGEGRSFAIHHMGGLAETVLGMFAESLMKSTGRKTIDMGGVLSYMMECRKSYLEDVEI